MESPLSQHLDTNYVPTPADVVVINQLLEKEQRSVDEIDVEMAALQRRRQAHTDFMAKHRNLLTPARRIPSDILSAIFRTLVSVSNRYASPHPTAVVTQVCRLWRDLTMETPLLWNNIDIMAPKFPHPGSEEVSGPEDYERRVEAWKETMRRICSRVISFANRAKGCDLHVSYSASDPPVGMLSSMPNSDDCGEWNFTIAPFLFLLRVTTHWKSLTLCLRTLVGKSPLLSMILKLMQGALPGLDRLSLEFVGRLPTQDDDAEWERAFPEGGPPVCIAPLTSFTARMSYEDLCRLQPDWSGLTDLDVGAPYYGMIFGPQEAANILSFTPNLVNCAFDFNNGLRATEFTPPSQPIVLTKLQSLTMFGIEVPVEFASSLDLPSLRRLSSIQNLDCSPFKDETSSAVVALILRYGEQLTHVSLVIASMKPSTFSLVLDKLPNVTRLDLVEDDPDPISPKVNPNPGVPFIPPVPVPYHTDFLQKLIPTPEGAGAETCPCACPKLESLIFDLGAHRGKGEDRMLKKLILDLVRSRRREPRHRGGVNGSREVAWLAKVGVEFKAGPVDWMLKELQSEGVDTDDVSFTARHPDIKSVPLYTLMGTHIPGVGSVIQGVEMAMPMPFTVAQIPH